MIRPDAFDGMLPKPGTSCAVCHRPIGHVGWTGYGRNVSTTLKQPGRTAIICWDCTGAEHRATRELIRRHEAEHRLLVAMMLAATTPLGETQ